MQGLDPEFFFVDGKTVPAEKILGERFKDNPIKFKNFKLYVDGYQAEINFNEPMSPERLYEELINAIEIIRNKYSEVSFKPVIKIDTEELKGLSEITKKFHCVPDENIYDKHVKVPDGETHDRRYAGGHIHIDIKYSDAELNMLIPYFDRVIGMPLSLLMQEKELEKERRKVYGYAGSFRRKPYGIEYRVPSSGWLWNSLYIYSALSLSEYAVNTFLYDIEQSEEILSIPIETVRNIIDNYEIPENINEILFKIFGRPLDITTISKHEIFKIPPFKIAINNSICTSISTPKYYAYEKDIYGYLLSLGE